MLENFQRNWHRFSNLLTKLRPQVSEIALDGHISCDHIKFVPGKIKTGYIRGHLPGIPDPT